MFTTISKKSKFRREVYPSRACPWNIRDKSRYSHAIGARRAGAEIVRVVQRGYEHRATTQFTLNFDFFEVVHENFDI